MEKFISKPTVIDAVQFLGKDSVRGLPDIELISDNPENVIDGATFKTIHGDRAVARIGDWIVEEAATGRYYPIKDSIFKVKYRKYEA